MWIAKNNDLIILASQTREELVQQLQFMVYTDIEETDIEYELYNGEYLTKEEIVEKEKETKIAQIKFELNQLDLKSIRAIRSGDEEYIKKYEEEAEFLRSELKELQK